MFADTIQYEFLAVGEIERKLRKSPNNINMEPLIICFRFVKSDNCLLWPFIEHTVIRPFLARKVLVFVKTGANLKLLIYMSSLGPKTSWLAVKQKHSVEEQLCKQRLIQYLIQKKTQTFNVNGLRLLSFKMVYLCAYFMNFISASFKFASFFRRQPTQYLTIRISKRC